MKRTVTITSIAALAIGLSAAIAVAGPYGGKGPGGPGMHRGPQINFEQLDLNGDGSITKEEIAGQAKARFDTSDADKDGFLTKEELQAGIEAHLKQRALTMADRMLERHDSDKDGKLSAEEMPQPKGKRAERMFDRMDANDDGTISEEEFAMMKNMRQGRKGGKMRHGQGQGKGWGQQNN